MSMIDYLEAREVLDFRANPTVEVDCYLEDGSFGRASVSGIKNVPKAVDFINETLDSELEGMDSLDLISVDRAMLSLKQKAEKPVTMAVSMAVARASSDFLGTSVRENLGSFHSNVLPLPLVQDKSGITLAENPESFHDAVVKILNVRQIQTLSEEKIKKNIINFSDYPSLTTLYEAIDEQKRSGKPVILSCLDSFAQDDFAADISVALSCDAILLRKDDTLVLNQLLRLEDEIEDIAQISKNSLLY